MQRAFISQAILLLPHPILTLLYLLAVRAERVQPGFAPIVALVALPLFSTLMGLAQLRRTEPAGSRAGHIVLLAIAALEISFTVLAAAVVGFAIGLQSL